MEILKGIEMIGKALWIKKQKVLILADLHIGYEEALNKQGVLVPRTQFKETKRKIEELLQEVKLKIIVINGDLKHEFGGISRQEWHETLGILDLLREKAKVILIKGNHDRILEPIARKKGLEIKEFYCIDSEKICILHGNEVRIEKEVNNAKILIIGHEHPAISLQEGMKSEIYKCFLLGRWKGKKLIVMPSFLPLTEGSDIRKEKLLSPYLSNIKNFEIFVLGDRIYKFGKLKEI
ncbi:metallophosphoesterase [Candidatus Pacearchaeota archaeon]|nr:metallophosphoesterase [Candidatus Pacearchaeota archaeon]